MSEYMIKAIGLVAQELEKRGIKFDVRRGPGMEVLCINNSVTNGPKYSINITNCSKDNDIKICVHGIISNIPDDKRERFIELCNSLNNEVRHLRFYLNKTGSVMVDYDVPIYCPDDYIGIIAYEMVVRVTKILDKQYPVLAKALYTNSLGKIKRIFRR